MSVLLWNVLFHLLLCFWYSSMGVDQSISFPKKFYYWNRKRSFPSCTSPLKAIDKSFHSACEWCRTGFTYGRALLLLLPSACPCKEAQEGTPQQAAGLELPRFLCQGNRLPARPVASSSFHTSVTFSLKINRPKQGRGSHPRAAGCQQSMLLPSVKGKQQRLTLLPQAQEH